MKTKITVFFILVMVACLPLKVLADQEVHGFAAGSLIIPMDEFYQDPADGGALEAYGLVYYLLDYKRPDCVTACASEQDCLESCGLTIYWVINGAKTEIDGIDLQIVATNQALTDLGAGAVVEHNDPDGGIAGASTILSYDTGRGDSANQVTYRGGVFILDYTDMEASKDMIDLAAAYSIINDARWSAVDVHEAQVSFSSPIFRKMQGIPPQIALMNDDEDRDGGNAEILESYLHLAGICDTSYDVLTPYDIAGIASDGTRISSKLFSQKYDFLWAPHWTAKDYSEDDLDNNGKLDVDDIMEQIQKFVKSGKSILAECASIEIYEHNSYGHFLTDKGLGHNEGSNDADQVIYHDKTQPYSQIGNDPIKFEPEGGHLHNWRPFHAGDDYNMDDEPDVSGGNSVYNPTVTRFTVDDTDKDGAVTEADWDYYVGGYAYGDPDFGYVVYLGGHKYATCKDNDNDDTIPPANKHFIYFEFDKDISNEIFTLQVYYVPAGGTETSITVDFDAADIGSLIPDTDTVLEIDFSGASLDGKKILNVAFTNTSASALTITKVVLASDLGNASQKFKILKDTFTNITHWNTKINLPLTITISQAFTIAAAPLVVNVGCTANDGCDYENLAGVRYVLNTLFNIKYTVKNKEYVRAPPIVSHPYLYQGSFEYPSNFGHFRRYDVTKQVAAGNLPVADWDAGAHRSFGHIKDAKTDNSDGRKVFTAQIDANGNWQPINFDTQAGSLLKISSLLNVTPNDGDDEDEIRVINSIRGQEWDHENGVFVERNYKLGGIMHSAPVIVKKGGAGTRFSNREEMAYVGDTYGMLHAFCTPHAHEKWVYIPSNLLGKLKNVRGDSYASQDFAAVDASATARDIYYDHDSDPATVDAWRTILVSPQGFGGTSIFALDVTDPRHDQWKVLWETTVAPDSTSPPTPGGGMGYAYRASLDKVKWPVLEDGDANGNGTPDEIIGYEAKWMVFVATSYAEFAVGHGGIHVFAFDLKTGARVWGFSAEYSSSDNDIPAAVTTIDLDDDTFADRVYVGDISGRMWELEARDGSNPYGTYIDATDPFNLKYIQIPLFNAGVGYPITVSPAILMHSGHTILVFGTGGADWAVNTNTYKIYGLDATDAKKDWDGMSQSEKNAHYEIYQAAGTPAWEISLAAGEKVWSTPTIAAGQIWIVTSSGSMEGVDPGAESAGSSKLRRLDLSGNIQQTIDFANKKIRGSLFVSNNHVYMTTFDNKIIQLGDGDFTTGTGNRVVLKSWHHE